MDVKYSDNNSNIVAKNKNSSPLRGKTANPPETPKIAIRDVVQAEHVAPKEPAETPSKENKLTLPIKTFVLLILIDVNEMLIPANKETELTAKTFRGATNQTILT